MTDIINTINSIRVETTKVDLKATMSSLTNEVNLVYKQMDSISGSPKQEVDVFISKQIFKEFIKEAYEKWFT